MRTKHFAALAALLFALALPFAAASSINQQKIHPIDSPVYKAIKQLYIEQGLALPSTTGPWTEAELEMMASRLDPAKMDEAERTVYDFIQSGLGRKAKLNQENFAFNAGLYSDLDLRAHSNPADFDDPDMWGGKGDWRMVAPFLRIPLEGWIGSGPEFGAYAYFNLDLLQNPRRFFFDDGHSFKDMSFSSSIPGLTPHTLQHWDLSWDFPYRAFGSFGGSWWNISIGRDRLSWGPGETGNFAVGDQLPFHDNFRAQAFAKGFKYTFSVSSFYHPLNYYTDKDPGDGIDYKIDLSYDQSHIKKGIKLLIGHRLEWRIGQKVNMALTESIAYQNETGAVDLSVLNPFILLHNLYIRSNSNSLITLEIDYAPVRHLSVYGQLAVDEFNVPGEYASNEPPTAIAGMVGAKTSFAVGKGLLWAAVEGAYTDPYLYIRDDGSNNPKKYGVDFIAGNTVFSGRNGFTLDPIGYRYGGDAVVGELKAGYDAFGRWNAEGSITYVAHGCFDIHTKWRKINAGDAIHGPTTSNPNGSWMESDDNALRNAVSHTLILSLKGGCALAKALDAYTQLDFITIGNKGNIEGVRADDLQFTLGLRISL